MPLWLADDLYVMTAAESGPDCCLPQDSGVPWYDDADRNPVLQEGQLQETCGRSLLSKKMNITLMRRCDLEMPHNVPQLLSDHGHKVEAKPDSALPSSSRTPLSPSSSSSSSSSSATPFTIAMTTCRRLRHFLEVAKRIESFVHSFSASLVTEVVVVDDGSSTADRMDMLHAFPEFTFVLKSSRSQGHAASLNMIVRHVSSRFFMYLEDDWLLLPAPFLAPSLLAAVTPSLDKHSHQRQQHPQPHQPAEAEVLLRQLVRLSIQVIHASLELHNQSSVDREPIAQVYLNDQRSRLCAVGLVDSGIDCGDQVNCQCPEEDMGKGGWAREARGAEGGAAHSIPFSLHEFGLLYEVSILRHGCIF